MIFNEKEHEAIYGVLGFDVSDEEIGNALKNYGGWHYPTLQIECSEIEQQLSKIGVGGMAWGTVHAMKIVLAIRSLPVEYQSSLKGFIRS